MSTTRRRIRVARAAASLACAGTLVAAAALAGGTHAASTGGTVVDAEIVSATTLVNDCRSSAASGFGTVLPDTGALTATGAGVCRVTFGSTQPAQLRIAQSDGTGTAMGFGTTAPTQLTGYVAPGRTIGAFGYDDNRAWLVGKASTVYRTDDAGATWGNPPGPAGNLWDVEATPGDPNTWWVVGENRIFQRTANAFVNPASAVTWTNLAAPLAAAGWPAAVDVNELTIPDTATIWVVGEQRWIGRYSIAGNSWTAFQHTTTSFGDLAAVDSLDASTVMAVSVDGSVLRTTTGATSSAGWAVTALPNPPEQMTDIAYASATRAYAVGLDGYVAVWDGTSWTDRSAQLDLPRDLLGVDSIPGSPNSLLALDGSGGVHRSDDAGLTWTHAATRSASRTGDIHATTATSAYVAAAERSFSSSHDGGATWTTQGPTGSEELTAIAASPVDGRRILAAGSAAYRSTNAGSSWNTAATGAAYPVRDVTLVSDTEGWGVGDAATILHTDDLGATWSAQTPPGGVTGTLTGVTGLDDRRAIAVGFDGTVIGTSNGGGTWTSRASGTTSHLMGVDSVDDIVLAVGASATVLRSTNAGASWSTIPGGSLPSTTADLLDVAMASDQVAYALTRHGVWRSADGGLTWSAAASLPSTRARAIAAAGRTVVVVGYDDRVEYSTDDGATFTGLATGTGMHIGSVAMVDSHTAVIGSADKRRMRMDVDTAGDVQVPDWSLASNDWDNASFFGVCLQAVGGSAIADWTEDAAGTANQCEADVADPWRALPAIASQAAHTSAAGSGNVDLVWGFKPDAAQRAGTYEAGVSFEAIAP
ncbi:MAG: hypothetical protein KDC46_12240 [Thermoleophilia bacterium]|nr:hypothetical protein [Thermoleophilia bacterium]